MYGSIARFFAAVVLCAVCAAFVQGAEDPVEALLSFRAATPVQVGPEPRPLAAFVEDVMNRLGLAFALGPGVRERNDTLTLRLAHPVSPLELLRITRQMLRGMGMSLTLKSGVVMVSRDTVEVTPLYGADGAVPASADAGQRVAVAVPLAYARYSAITPWLSQAFAEAGVSADQEPTLGMLLLSGPAVAVDDALRAVRLLDQPLHRASDGRLVKPRYLAPEALAAELIPVLQSEGIDADGLSLGATLVVLPLQSLRAVAVFTADSGLADHVAEWVRALDRPSAYGPEGAAVFSYAARHVLAADLVKALAALPPSASTRQTKNPAPPAEAPQASLGDTPDAGASNGPREVARPRSGTLAADPNRNVVMFRGRPEDWQRLYPAIRDMDAPVPVVEVEVTIAELTLDDRFASGLEWLASGSVHGDDVQYGTLGGLGLGQGGFGLQLSEGTTVRALLRLLATDESVQVRARERLLVSNGRPARLDVGAEVPVLSATSRVVSSAGAPLINSVDYRDTGFSLSVLPSLRPGGEMELEISQDLSFAVETTSSGIASPTIRESRLRTTITARDGTVAVLGGLVVNETGSSDRRALPLHLPGDGARDRRGSRKELLVMVRPRLL